MELADTMGRLTMGSLFSEDSVSRGLGGFNYERDTVGSEDPARSSIGEVAGIIKAPGPLRSSGGKVMLNGKNMFKASAKKVMFASTALQKFANPSTTSDDLASPSDAADPSRPAITSLAALGDGFFLSASLSDNVISLHKTVGEQVEFVREFKGHKSGITSVTVLDGKGRFLSAGIDKTVILWDSRYNIEEESDDETGMQNEQLTLLATFHDFERYVHSIGVLDEGLFIRPTDDLDLSMVSAVAKKTALEGAASVHRAAALREYIECSGSFATASRNQHKVQIWRLSLAKDDRENVAKIDLLHELEHDTSIGAIATKKTKTLTGDAMGAVHLWELEKGFRGLNGGSWTKIHKYTPWKIGSAPSGDVMQQSIQGLCFLSDQAFVSGTKNGVLRVWPNVDSIKDFEVNKKQASSIKVTSKAVTCIQKLHQVKDPNTGERCMAFSAAFADGRMVSMALYPQDPTEKAKNELVMFHVYSNSAAAGSNRKAIKAIALSEDVSGSNGFLSEPMLVAGDDSGNIQTLKPKWNPNSSASA